MTPFLARIVCYVWRHRWTRTAFLDVIVWKCARCHEERLVGDRKAIEDYRVVPDLPPPRSGL
jgi:hypothetical protein